MFTTLDTFHFRDAALKHVAQRNISVMVTTLDTSHFEMSRLNDVAPRNMLLMSFTLDTSHLEMSHLNNLAQETIRYISCTLDTSHSVIGTCGPLEQSPFGESLMHHHKTRFTPCIPYFRPHGQYGPAPCRRTPCGLQKI